ncbi:MAG: GHKL domain-containing protein [Spirochaetaceae bacterium]|nr:MAG: GHKL domain-containing protein [Spirochaetaceae bacterium]
MPIDFVVFLSLTPFAGLALVASGIAVWRFRRSSSACLLLVYFALVGTLLLGNTLELLTRSSSATLLMAIVQAVVFAFIPPIWLAFSWSYARPDSEVGPYRAIGLLVIPFITSLLAVTSGQHALYWSSVEFVAVGSLLSMRTSYGIWFWVHGAYSYLLLLSGAALIIYAATASRPEHSRQAGWLVLGALTPLVLNLIYVFRVFPALVKDYTPLGFAAAGVFFYVGVRWFHLFHVRPIARNIVYNDLEVALITLDTQGRIIDFNRSAAILLEMNEEVLGQGLDSVPAAHAVLGSRSALHAARFDSAGSFAGRYRELEVQLTPLSGPRDQPVGMLVMISDVSSWRRLLEERDKAVENLTANNVRLEAAQTQLIRQERLSAIGALSAELAHEINNPLTVLKSSTSSLVEIAMLAPHRSDVEKAQLVADIEPAIRRIADVTRSLVRLAQPTQTKPQAANLTELIEQALTITHPSYRKVMRIERHFTAEPLIVECYSEDIVQVFINIIINAAQACSDTDNSLTIATSALHEPKGARCCFSNTGPDIAPEIRSSIFEPFFTTKAERGGTGLGLSSAKHLIETRHGGHIALEPGLPVSFVVDLPAKVSTSAIGL